MSESLITFQSQLDAVMEALVRTAVCEITEMVKKSFAGFQHEIARRQRENESLQRRLHVQIGCTGGQGYGVQSEGKTEPFVKPRCTSGGTAVCNSTETREECRASGTSKLENICDKECCRTLWECQEIVSVEVKQEMPDLHPITTRMESTELESIRIKDEVNDVGGSHVEHSVVTQSISGLEHVQTPGKGMEVLSFHRDSQYAPQTPEGSQHSSEHALGISNMPSSAEKTIFKFTNKNVKKKTFSSSVKQVQINVGVMVQSYDGILKRKRGNTVPVAVNPLSSAEDILACAKKKLKSVYDNIPEGPYFLLYPDGSIVQTIPGSAEPFILADYKTSVGKPYQRVTLFICLKEDFEKSA
ncbi:uncharacterized protein LOC136755536 [Amia ocellicauda]|uniref:uncharacterized protein LOC136755536 n=1 Tax=Amia ocellicauda TaxID=2972642 RepID=UPI0034645087